MESGFDVENVIVESKLGILRDRVLVAGREFAVQRGRHGWRSVPGSREGIGRASATTDGGIDCRSNRRLAPSRFGSVGVTRRSRGAGVSTASVRCLAIA